MNSLRSYYGHYGRDGTSANRKPGEISEDDLLTWEMQLRREGTLPPEVQLRLLEHVADHKITA